MSSWWERIEFRRRELSEGVDADLVSTNRKTSRLALGLIGFGLVLILLNTKIHLPVTLRKIVVALAIVSWISGVLTAHWARQEQVFLEKPDPEKPPSIFGK